MKETRYNKKLLEIAKIRVEKRLPLADRVTVWFDPEAYFLEVAFSDTPAL